MHSEDLAEKQKLDRAALENQKLELEIKNLRSRWYLPSLIQAIPATLVVVFSIFMAWSTGLLDAKRERLALETTQLQLEKTRLQQEEKQIRKEVASLTSELENSRSELEAYKLHEQAIRNIRELWPSSTIEYVDNNHGWRVKFAGSRFHVVAFDQDGVEVKPTKNDDALPNTLEGIKLLAQIRNVRLLEIVDIPLTKADLQSLGQLRSLMALSLTRNELSDEAMEGFPTFTELNSLEFHLQSFTIADNLNRCVNLTNLNFNEVPVNSRCLQLLGELKRLESLGLHSTAIADSDLEILRQFPRLNRLCIAAKGVTESGIRKIATYEPLRNLFIADELWNESMVQDVLSINPRLIVIPAKYAINYGSFFTARE